jgi:hypothetical protein
MSPAAAPAEQSCLQAHCKDSTEASEQQVVSNMRQAKHDCLGMVLTLGRDTVWLLQALQRLPNVRTYIQLDCGQVSFADYMLPQQSCSHYYAAATSHLACNLLRTQVKMDINAGHWLGVAHTHSRAQAVPLLCKHTS